ncbi:hypothetical protein RJT34_29832 [Clitoria ternatea]|uniref:Uncharacterized protein n=1 Tax=Clitoria ternatea TaxID=43366 RepID=A0AAN9ERZ3_CLITE
MRTIHGPPKISFRWTSVRHIKGRIPVQFQHATKAELSLSLYIYIYIPNSILNFKTQTSNPNPLLARFRLSFSPLTAKP